MDDLNTSPTPGTRLDIPMPLTYAKHQGLTTLYMKHTDDLPEYPITHEHGFCYVVAARGRSQVEMEQLAHSIQYAKQQRYGQKKPIFSPFLVSQAKKWTWKCSGVLTCEYLSKYLQSYHHTSVDEEIWQEIRKYQSDAEMLGSDLGKRNAYNYYRSKVALFKKGHACISQLPSCKPVFKQCTQMNGDGSYSSYISCVNDALSKHHHGAIQGHTNINLQFLEDLFNKEILPATEECGVFEPLSSRRKFCSRDHPQGPGLLKHIKCDVVLTALVPVDIQQCPYILFVSHGVHKHAPPPPTKAPGRIIQGVEDKTKIGGVKA